MLVFTNTIHANVMHSVHNIKIGHSHSLLNIVITMCDRIAWMGSFLCLTLID